MAISVAWLCVGSMSAGIMVAGLAHGGVHQAVIPAGRDEYRQSTALRKPCQTLKLRFAYTSQNLIQSETLHTLCAIYHHNAAAATTVVKHCVKSHFRVRTKTLTVFTNEWVRVSYYVIIKHLKMLI